MWTGKITLGICLNPLIKCKEGLVCRIRAGEGFSAWWWEDCLKYLKRRWNRKKERENKEFKKGGNLGQGVGALKKGGGLEWIMGTERIELHEN